LSLWAGAISARRAHRTHCGAATTDVRIRDLWLSCRLLPRLRFGSSGP